MQSDPVATEQMSIAMAGHVDHGKSTVIGRLLAETGSFPDGKIEQVRAMCQRNARPFEYAFLLDALKDEQAQGITIDTARCFFKTAKRNYILIDAPGHIEFLKNMITGAARAEAILLVIDAAEGIRENSTRHGYMVSMLGIRQVAILVNKMDSMGYDVGRFEAIKAEYSAFLAKINLEPLAFIPISGREGANLTTRSAAMPWYQGPTVLEQIDAFKKPEPPVAMPFRFPVQGVYKFTEQNDDRRIFAGTVDTGSVAVGDEVVFLPSGKHSRVASIERFNAPADPVARAGEALGFCLHTQIYVKPGELLVKAAEIQPSVSTRLRANLFWMGKAPMIKHKTYKLKLGAARSAVTLVNVVNVLDASELTSVRNKQQIDRHDVAECVLECPKPIAFDLERDLATTGRFVIVDDYEIAGAGIVLEALRGQDSVLKDHFLERERHWESSEVSADRRAGEYRHRAKFVLLTGRTEDGSADKAQALAKALELRLFWLHFKAYYLGARNVALGLDAHFDEGGYSGDSRIRRLGELARILTDSGQIFIASIPDLDVYDIQTLELLNKPNEILVVNVGGTPIENYSAAFTVPAEASVDGGVNAVGMLLRQKDVILEYSI
ncbi:MAG: adenylyl-sulfate kinase [Lentisphaerae bacterium RIFOXYB12_FULL_65_16]|nr:MAG: adenylyl-sulfate kinase [Lentisphaerae bacterium RIFOXYA12_64_32]OGV84829.1 MAG: adenylyl-sulfate kinase [Lentisphaerae bacterium RIFOXYB12_FULL_65_16]